MATQAIAGFKGQVQCSTAAGGALTKLAEIKNFSITVEGDELDVTTAESSGDREFIVGLRKWSAKIEEFFLSGNAQSQAIYDVLASTSTSVGRQKLTFDFFPTGSTSTAAGTAWTGTGYVKQWELMDDDSRVALVNVTIQGSGVLARS